MSIARTAEIARIMARTMKAAVIYEAGGPEAFKIEQRPVPNPEKGQVLIAVKAFGINRSELFTRQGHSPGVKFPRVLGIEAVGIVDEAPGGEFRPGTVVGTAMGGMGRDFDGGYAEFTCVPAGQVQAVTASPQLPWDVLGAMPEMLQTAYGSLFKALRLEKGDRLLIRGGTTSIGLAAAAIAKSHGTSVTSTTRQSGREALLQANGADAVVIDDGQIAGKIEKPFDKVLELIGTVTLRDSLRCAREGGIVCMTGIVGNSWTLENLNPMEFIPTAVCLTSYAGGPNEFMELPLNEMAELVASGKMKMPVGKVFKLDEIVEAHTVMEKNKAGGKIVVLTS